MEKVYKYILIYLTKKKYMALRDSKAVTASAY